MTRMNGIERMELTNPAQPCCECDACGLNTMYASFQVRWIQIGFMPVLPLGVSARFACMQCGASPSSGQMSAHARAYYKRQLSWAFWGGQWFVLLGGGLWSGAVSGIIANLSGGLAG